MLSVITQGWLTSSNRHKGLAFLLLPALNMGLLTALAVTGYFLTVPSLDAGLTYIALSVKLSLDAC